MERKSRFSQWLRRPRSGSDGRRYGHGSSGARSREDLLLAAADAGFPLRPAAHPSGYRCSCDRIGCPTPGPAPRLLRLADQSHHRPRAGRAAGPRSQPQANFITATGMVHDVLDVPLEAGRQALERLLAPRHRRRPGGRVRATTGCSSSPPPAAPRDEDEWWPCELDCHPETMDEHPGLRWHCRGSYVLVPPARLPGDGHGGLAARPGAPAARPADAAGDRSPTPAPSSRGEASDHEAAAWPIGR